MAATQEQLKLLGEPTPAEEVKTRPGKGNSGDLSYIDARFVYERLDSTVGPANWQDDFRIIDDQLVGGIGVLVAREPNPEWVWKWDVGTESTIEAVKGNFSDALKRAGVHWGIGRDLYDEKSAARGGGSAARGGGTTKSAAKPRTRSRAKQKDAEPEATGLSEKQKGFLLAGLRELGIDSGPQRKLLTMQAVGKTSSKDMTNKDFDRLKELIENPEDKTNEGMIALAREATEESE